MIVGGRRPEIVGGTVPLFNQTFPVFGKLALTGVGPFERSYFVTAETAARIAAAAQRATGRAIITSLGQSPYGTVGPRQGRHQHRSRFASRRPVWLTSRSCRAMA